MTLGIVAQWVAFLLFSLIAVAGALGMATTMSMFRSGILLMASFIGVAGLFILLSADLLGLLQIMMYIGGMLVMILFMVLFAHDPGGDMMAGMEMSPVEKLFSLGLLPKGGGNGHGAHEDMAGMDHSEMDHAEMDHDEMGHGDMDHDAMDYGDMDHDAMDHGDMDMPGMQHEQEHPHMDHGAAVEYTCPMHPEVVQSEPGSCPKCGMTLVPAGMDMDMSMTTPVKREAALLAAASGLILVGLLLLRPAWPTVTAVPDPNSAQRIGILLMEKYMMAFEGAGLLILLGIFGAVWLGRSNKHPNDEAREAAVAVDAPPPQLESDELAPLVADWQAPAAVAAPEAHQPEHQPHPSQRKP